VEPAEARRKADIDASTRGVWKLTPRGRARASGSAANATEELLLANQATLKDLVYENEAEVKRRIITELHSLGSTEFEQFYVSLLGPLGYEQLRVTNRGANRGIDGDGLFRQGVVTIRSAFQAKRWRNNAISRPEIDKFRGAIQGDYDHGVFLPRGSVHIRCGAASIKKGAISLLLLDGEAIAESMIHNGIGVVRDRFNSSTSIQFFDFPAANALL
jgi:restriction system protein